MSADRPVIKAVTPEVELGAPQVICGVYDKPNEA
jgi:hypothetical protein